MNARRLGLLALGAAGVALAPLAAIEITLPAETERLIESPLPGYTLATTYCYACHSIDYVRVQPTGMSQAAWRASVVKMQKTFGAPVPDEAIDPIAEYLARTYGADRPNAAKK